MEQVYLQTYSLGKAMEEAFLTSLEKVAQIGYSGVEFAGGYGGMEAEKLKTYLAQLDLAPISSHVGLDKIEAQLPYLAALGASYVICPGTPLNTYDEIMAKAEEMNRIGKLAKEQGLTFGYHNHYAEFNQVQDQYVLDLLLQNTDPACVTLQLDAGWAAYAGIDPAAYLAQHAGRCSLLHVKEAHNEKTGCGIIDWQNVIRAARESGVAACIVEREGVYENKDIFSCVAEDLMYLHNQIQ